MPQAHHPMVGFLNHKSHKQASAYYQARTITSHETTNMTEPDHQEQASAADNSREVLLTRAPVELFKILKFEGLAGSGGEAKAAIAAGQVRVNGKPDLRKRRQIVAGDRIEFGGEELRIRLAPPSR